MGNVPRKNHGRIGIINKHLTAGKTVSEPEWKIIYTYTDEAPLLATYSLLPIINRFTKPYAVSVDAIDISVAHRVLSLFMSASEFPDTLSALGELTNHKEANIIKLPNVSASIPQLEECIAELRAKGYDIPPFDPGNKELVAKYGKILGSAVNPVLREGNSDRRVAKAVKEDAKKHPHRMIKPYPNDSASKVVHMQDGDFYANELGMIMPKATSVSFELVAKDGTVTQLRPPLALLKNEVLDATFLSTKKLREFYTEELLNSETMVALHLKCTMMKVSDPIMFGHAVTIFYSDVFEKHKAMFKAIGVNPNNGLGDVYSKLKSAVQSGKITADQQMEVEKDIIAVYDNRPEVAMVDSAEGITNFHVPSDVIIDASMPVVVRDGGKMYGRDDKLHDVKCIIPDGCYATMYKRMMEYCKEHGAWDPATMGSVSNVGLMARKAEEYGSHDKTFEIPADGKVLITDTKSGKVYFEHAVEKGDIYRACQAKEDAIMDWIQLAVHRGEKTGVPVVFWLDEQRGHDRCLIEIVNKTIGKKIKTTCDWSIMKPEDAMQFSCDRSKAGLDTISATGNVLRDYLTDLFPILELGTSAKMLSIVPLLAGGGLYETGAGGSAPKHVEQFLKEGHLRWDSLGEFLALAVSLEDLGEKSKNPAAVLLGNALNEAAGKLLENSKSPSRKTKEIDNRGSHFYLALYWAEALTKQTANPKMAEEFKGLYAELKANEEKIAKDLIDCQGKSEDIGGYYYPDFEKTSKAMRPSATFNAIIDKH